MSDHDRRLVMICIPPFVLVEMLTVQSIWTLPQGLPPEVRVVGSGHDFTRNCFYLVIEHPTFAPVPLGQEIPTLDEHLHVERWGV
jgi:hypothetical protein